MEGIVKLGGGMSVINGVRSAGEHYPVIDILRSDDPNYFITKPALVVCGSCGALWPEGGGPGFSPECP